MTGLPRGSLFGSTWNAVTGEEQMQIANAYIRANYRAMGAVALVEARRAGGPFDFTDCTNLANFPSSLWTDPTHPNSAGKAILAQYIADVFKRLPAR
jgi:lysophospholipase L1-like esterase